VTIYETNLLLFSFIFIKPLNNYYCALNSKHSSYQVKFNPNNYDDKSELLLKFVILDSICFRRKTSIHLFYDDQFVDFFLK